MSSEYFSNSTLHSYIFAQKSKPYEALESLFSHLLPHSQKLLLTAGSTYEFSPDEEHSGLILLHAGVASLCHSENGLHMSTIFAPSILGLIDGYSLFYNVVSRPNHYMHAETDCNCSFIPTDAFTKIAKEESIWHDVARILAYRLMVMSVREQELVGVDSYLKVRSLLIELWLYPEIYRCKINVLNFIMNRTGLSRSRTMAILSELKKGKYIEIKSGKLIMQRKLPLAY
ncbi:winged helix-turn-helix transcriptional regulator [Lelliottia nimipressuralis]|uniref:Helix-turn-helix domain-containing protein n=1 Tax=Lelliottia nimipressuralis TaxID=69220 RepID=A0ABD4KF71_9ENTR|nr:winged helix-turn-helix transcriptional regulator [Lelliottia nimipressuralis]MBF4180415.1 helix-turn-helix domain-containing protein [Lelliottia nimipressuralis]